MFLLKFYSENFFE
jgi:hypothetical protein